MRIIIVIRVLMMELKSDFLCIIGHDLRTVGYSTLTDILNVVAPPISEHEVIQVWSSHDMEGFEGVESLIYKALARVCGLICSRRCFFNICER